MSSSFPTRNLLAPGMVVVIIEKQNQKSGVESVGKIDRILSGGFSHPHGLKVMLDDGLVGRVKRVM